MIGGRIGNDTCTARLRSSWTVSLVIPPDLVKQWERQLSTPYSELSDKEKESDREQVMKYLPVIAAELCK